MLKYNHRRPFIPCCPSNPGSGHSIPESVRIQSLSCEVRANTSESANTNIPLVVVNNTPVDVGTTRASFTSQQRVTTVLNGALNPYDPNTRFNQYFPAPPIPLACPVRIPSNEPLPSIRPCVGVALFKGSAIGR